MKKIIAAALAASVFCFAFSSCRDIAFFEDNETELSSETLTAADVAGEVITAEANNTGVANNSDAGGDYTPTGAENPDSDTNASLTESEIIPYGEEDTTATEPVSAVSAASGSYRTSKGYKIETIDGVTYIDGVLVVNKTYSLPASYAPGALTSECDAAYMRMKQAAAAEGLSIYIGSDYRSYATQESIYNRYCARDGQAAADTYSARPGHSEHQTGLAIDLNDISSSFAYTAAGKWVAEHCHEYGFIIRYPDGKQSITGYMYEPWHIRYVGDIATDIYNSGLCLEEYFGITSEYQ